MFDLYHAPDMAENRQHELYAKIANDRLARAAQAGDQASVDDRISPARRVIVAVTGALAAVGGAFATAGRRPHQI